MLTGIGTRGRTALGLFVTLLILAGMILTGASGAQAENPSPAPDLGDLPNGVTVSWPPTSKPVQIQPGTAASASFWVTNDTQSAVPIDIKPATAVPGDNGSLSVTDGADPRFAKVTLAPSDFRAAPGSTTEVKETVVAPSDLPPGVYLLPVVVRPQDERDSGNIQIKRAIVGLTTFQVPGKVHIALTTSLTPAVPPAGSMTRKLPGLPTIEVGRSAGATLTVTSQSTGGFYAYYEVVGATTGLGSLTLDGHAPGLPADIRADQSLYFPGMRRDFAVSWTAGPLTLARQTLKAEVSFNPQPTEVRSVAASATLICVSPWWIGVALAVLLLIALSSLRRTVRLSRAPAQRRRRAERKARGRTSTMFGRAVLVVVAVLAASLAVYWLLGAVILLAAIAFILTWRASKGLDAAGAATRVVPAYVFALVTVIAGVGMLVATFLRDVSPGYAIALTSAAACSLLACDAVCSRESASALVAAT